jgi:hypothetical protein
MSSQFEEIQRQIIRLQPEEKAALAHKLIEELDESTDENAERLWLEESARRYEAYQRGAIPSRDGDEVMKTVRELHMRKGL